ncbi:MAG: twin-arginine translocase subunit TatC [Rikenellaceae bacterium]
MTFWDHIEELRWVIGRIVGVWVVIAIGYFVAMPYIFESVILAPCNNDFILYEILRSASQIWGVESSFVDSNFQVTLININLAAPLLIHLSTAFALSIITTTPYLFYEGWRFVKPALYPAEQRGVKIALLFGSVMFYIGVAVGYFLIYPLTLRFLSTYQLSGLIENTISLNSYIENFTMLIISMGIAFEIPLVLWLLSLMGIITHDVLRQYRRHAIVAIVIIAAVITPTSDPFTLAIVALPLYILYELSLLIVRQKRVQKRD